VTTMTAPHTDDALASEPGRSLIKENQPWFVGSPPMKAGSTVRRRAGHVASVDTTSPPDGCRQTGGQPSRAAMIQAATFERMGRDRKLCCISRCRGGQR
jgi:hypothetical protein